MNSSNPLPLSAMTYKIRGVFRKAGNYTITTSDGFTRRQKYCIGSAQPMNKFPILIGIGVSIVIIGLVLGTTRDTSVLDQTSQNSPQHLVVMAMSSSRPGCEATGCYLPTQIHIKAQETITWINEDRGFHTVTTGYYDTPDGMVESEQIAPTEQFSFTFAEPGEFHYYCRLHPWMEGTIVVS